MILSIDRFGILNNENVTEGNENTKNDLSHHNLVSLLYV